MNALRIPRSLLFLAFGYLILSLMLAGCGSGATITGLALNLSTDAPTVGTSMQAQVVTVGPRGGADVTGKAVWASSSPGIASVSTSGMVVALAVGKTNLTAQYSGFTVSRAITVAPASTGPGGGGSSAGSLSITPAGASPTVGDSVQYTATFTANGTSSVSSDVTWSVLPASVASINSTGKLSALSAGAYTVTATKTSGGLTATAVGMVKAATGPVDKGTLTLTPVSASVPLGTVMQFTATLTLGGVATDVTNSLQWSVTPTTVASIDNAGKLTPIALGDFTVTATRTSDGLAATVKGSVVPSRTPVGPTLTGIDVIPTSASIAAGTQQQFSVRGTFSDGSTQDVSTGASWASSSLAVATVDANGVASGLAVGQTSITATLNGMTSSAALNITAATLQSVSISPSSASFAKGTSQQFLVLGVFSDGSHQDLTQQAQWTTSDAGVVSVDANGLARAQAAGSASVSATINGKTSTTAITITPATAVSLALSPSNPAIAKGISVSLAVTATFSDGTTQNITNDATWSSSDTSVVTVDVNGRATGVAVGSAEITATFGGQSISTSGLSVTPAVLASLSITPLTAQIPLGTTQQFIATGTFTDGTTTDLSSQVLWSSSNTSALVIDADGVAKSVSVGSATLSATLQGVTVSTNAVQATSATVISLAITPTSATIAKGTSQQFHVTGTFSDATTRDLTSDVAWMSSDNSVLAVDANGRATALTTGSATLTATYAGQSISTSPIQSTSATVVSVTLIPSSGSVPKGTNLQFNATATFSDGTTQDITSSVVWNSSDPTIVSIDATGHAHGNGTGPVTITATYGGVTYSTSAIQGEPAVLASIQVTPVSANLLPGQSQQFTAIATFTDGTMSDVSSSIAWSTSDPAVVTISATGRATAIAQGSATLTALYNGSTVWTGSVTVNPIVLASITVTPTSSSIAAGTQQQFSVRGTFNDGTTADVSTQASWSSSDPSTASVDTNGVALGLQPGQANIVATIGPMQSSASLNVTSATLVSVALSPSNASFAKGTTQQFLLIGTFSDGTHQDLSQQATWTSSDPSMLSVDVNGLAMGNSVGSAQITATAVGMTATTPPVEVTAAVVTSIALAPNSPSLPKGTSQALTLTAIFSDGTTQDVSNTATWTSSDPSVVTVDNNGLAQAVSVGSAQITASFGGSTASTSGLQVTPAALASIALSPATAQIPVGTTQQFTAAGTFTDGTTQDLTSQAVWSSSNTAAVTVDADGLAHAVSANSTVISATLNGVTGSTGAVQGTPAVIVSISVSPQSVSVGKGTSQQFHATGTFSDGTTRDLSSDATWTSSNSAVLAIDANGNATGIDLGQAALTASYNGQTVTTAQISVTPATVVSIIISPSTATIAKGTSQQFTATATLTDGTTQDLSSAVVWSSSDSTVVSINASGSAQGVGTGAVTLSATFGGVTASTGTINGSPATVASLTISPASASVVAGGTQQFAATATYTDNTSGDVSTSTTWSSSNTAVATVNGAGLGSAITAGNTSITANFAGVTASADLTVTPANSGGGNTGPTVVSVQLTPINPTVTVGATVQMLLLQHLSDGTTQTVTSTDVTWQTTVASVASVDAHGVVTGVTAGSAQIWGTYAGIAYGVSINVSPATLSSITLLPLSTSIANGTTQSFHAIGNYSDGSTQDITGSVAWASSDNNTATVTNSGVATGHAMGSVIISASSAGVSANTTLTVTSAMVASIVVSPAQPSLPAGGFLNLTVIATMTDGTSQDVTASATFASSNPTVVTVATDGTLHATGTGTATVTVTVGGVQTTATVGVTAATLQSIAITPTILSLPSGIRQQLTATGTYSDGSTRDLTNNVTWAVTDSNIALVSSTGLLTAAGPGATTISATSASISGSLGATVTNAVITEIAVSPASTSLAAGQTLQMQATARLSDNSQQDVTGSAHWSLDNSALASIGTGSSSGGLFTAKSAGTVNVQATVGGISGSATVSIQSAVLVSLSVSSGSSLSLPAGLSQTLIVTGLYSDGSTAVLNSSATWTSSNVAAATVDGDGTVHGIAVGTANLTVTVAGVSTQVVAQVTTAVVSTLAITPTNPSVAVGLTLPLTATATYSDGGSRDVTSTVSWVTSDVARATVSQTGLVTAIQTGSVTVTATIGGTMQQVSLTVSPAVLQSISVAAADGISTSFAKGMSLQLQATGHYSDGSTRDLTSTATWTSANAAVGLVSNTGVATGISTGSFNAMAQVGAVSGSMSVTVSAALLQSITVTPANTLILNILGAVTQFHATGNYSDGSTQDLTNSVHWGFPSGLILGTITQSGAFSPLGLGLGSIQATLGSVSGSTGFTVISLL